MTWPTATWPLYRLAARLEIDGGGEAAALALLELGLALALIAEVQALGRRMIGDLVGRGPEAIDVELRHEGRGGLARSSASKCRGRGPGPSGPLKLVGLRRSPLSAALASLRPLSAPVRPTSPPKRLAAMSCLPAEVTVLGTRYWSARGPLPLVRNRMAASRGSRCGAISAVRVSACAEPWPAKPKLDLKSEWDCRGRRRHSPKQSGEAARAKRPCATSDEASVGPLSLQVTP